MVYRITEELYLRLKKDLNDLQKGVGPQRRKGKKDNLMILEEISENGKEALL